ncbi:hypothetical protein [Legionella sp. 16cNR16C]|uniref:hypothetical protein n=1 Tax=Legionella sp. 16cNR16C TaxID=2905656 RepID=UPI001E30B917|nr:hypothetical protein [Legionella sp. 16cNR16C]MCE3045828.1 hypothetical protein [Legionella sp. 16cNR16C]
MAVTPEEFREKFYRYLVSILNTPGKIQRARQNFHSSDDTKRFMHKESFGIQHWKDEDALNLTAAVAEAHALTMEYYQREPIEITQKYNQKFLNTLISELASPIHADEPLKLLVEEIKTRMRVTNTQPSLINHYTLLGGGAALLVLGVAALASSGSNTPKI